MKASAFKCTYRNVSVQVQVWKCQCVSVSVEVSVFKRFSGRTLRNAFGKNIYRIKKKYLPKQKNIYRINKNIRCAMKSLGIPSRVGGRSSGPLVRWSSGPLVCWSPGPVAWSPAVRWSTDLICVLFVVFRCHIHCLRESSCVGLKRTGFSTTPAQARAAHLWIWCAAGGGAAPPPTPPAPRNLHFIPDTRACHEINILR